MRRRRPQTDAPNTCPHDGTPVQQSPRYPKALCRGCVDRATDLEGRPVQMGNTHLSGGFQALHIDDRTVCDQVTEDGLVLVDGVRFRAGEARFGGVVLQPEDSA
ncbi:hypothetical protein [Salininema proteolyticum]|uniref:Uncharacterized protein n=1 Tax=Salininema proteolyticum TaxID=1607685 RepID=A0ABV8TWR1_9ACTN